jgi:hypothetical protein
MAAKIDIAWEYYLQGFRLHHRMTREANLEATRMFEQAARLRRRSGADDFARAYSHWSFTLLTALLNDWLETGDAKRAARLRKTIVGHAETAVKIDPEDYDNLWSRASAYLYDGNVKGALADYKRALTLAEKQNAPPVTIESLRVDQADALFFTGGRKEIQQAIDDTLLAMARVATDPKARFWNWSLGWAYYELAFYDKGGNLDNYARSLAALSLVPKPNPHVRKNIIANLVALDRLDAAQRLAREFVVHHPGYTIALEDKWPYSSANEARRARFKDHLAKAGLPATAARRRSK